MRIASTYSRTSLLRQRPRRDVDLAVGAGPARRGSRPRRTATWSIASRSALELALGAARAPWPSSSRTTAFSCRARIISASSRSARARSNEPRRRSGQVARSGACAWRASGSWWRAAQSAISNTVKSTMPTGTGCARTSDWIAPSPLDSSDAARRRERPDERRTRATNGSSDEPDRPVDERSSRERCRRQVSRRTRLPVGVAAATRVARAGATRVGVRALRVRCGSAWLLAFLHCRRLFRLQGASPIWIE